MDAKYAVGIDLGTTNSVLMYADLAADPPQIDRLLIPQLVAASSCEASGSLPSFVYLASDHETGSGAFDLPWQVGQDYAVGEFARQQAAQVPQRTVGAAKSWLCHSRVDRHQDILPWQAPADVPQISPVTASRRYLEHLQGAWQAAFPDAPLNQQLVVLTVPASFDASARELTREAAVAAGLPEDLVLLEEPQAAVYSWLAVTGDRWRELLSVGDVLLVCDVGGGTTDLTLVRVAEEGGELVLRRAAVGNHLLIGGDNMDLTLAHFVASQFESQGLQLDPWQSVALWHACRAAKEALLAPDAPPTHPVSILGRGSKLIGGTVTTDVDRNDVTRLLVDGFFPRCAATDRPLRERTSGFQEIGLPFETDTAITRHLAAFLQQHAEGDEGLIEPTHLLFNGGVFKADQLRQRLLDVMSHWSTSQTPPQLLAGVEDLDHAVARGAAYYGWAKRRGGIRIRGGTARSYYLGIETAGLAIPGAPRPLRALCVVSFGMEEGSEMEVPGDPIGLIVGQPARFRFFSSAQRKHDPVGRVLDRWSGDELVETDSLEATLSTDSDLDEPYVPVKFHSRVTELGMFELWCANTQAGERWKLEFSVRADASSQ